MAAGPPVPGHPGLGAGSAGRWGQAPAKRSAGGGDVVGGTVAAAIVALADSMAGAEAEQAATTSTRTPSHRVRVLRMAALLLRGIDTSGPHYFTGSSAAAMPTSFSVAPASSTLVWISASPVRACPTNRMPSRGSPPECRTADRDTGSARLLWFPLETLSRSSGESGEETHRLAPGGTSTIEPVRKAASERCPRPDPSRTQTRRSGVAKDRVRGREVGALSLMLPPPPRRPGGTRLGRRSSRARPSVPVR